MKVLLAVVLLLPLLEIVALIMVGKAIGVLWTIALLIAMAVLGTWLAKRETGRTYRALQTALGSGKMPTDEMTDAILVMVGGFLLILPGFLTDILALVLILPFTRPAARRLLQTVVAAKALGVTRGGATRGSGPRPGPQRPPGHGQVIEGEIVSEDGPPSSWGRQDGPRSLD